MFGHLNALVFSGDSINGVINLVTWRPFESGQSILALAQDYDDGRLFWAAFSASNGAYVFGYIDVGQRTLFTCHSCELDVFVEILKNKFAIYIFFS